MLLIVVRNGCGSTCYGRYEEGLLLLVSINTPGLNSTSPHALEEELSAHLSRSLDKVRANMSPSAHSSGGGVFPVKRHKG